MIDAHETSVHVDQTTRHHILNDYASNIPLLRDLHARTKTKKPSQFKNKFVELAAFFYRLAVGRHASARAIIAPIHCHTRTHHAVSCHGNKKGVPSVLLWLAPGRLGVEWQQVAGTPLLLSLQLILNTSTPTCSRLVSDTFHWSTRDHVSFVE